MSRQPAGAAPLGPPPPQSASELRERWMADERSYYQATYQGHQQQYSGQQHHGGRGGGPGPGATGPPGAPGPQPPAVGWGGQQIQEPSGYRVPWFGRSRSKYGGRFGGKKGDPGPPGAPPRYGGPGGAGPSNRGAEDALSVEEMAVIIQKLGQNEELPEVIFRALHHVDSRAVALLLKDLRWELRGDGKGLSRRVSAISQALTWDFLLRVLSEFVPVDSARTGARWSCLTGCGLRMSDPRSASSATSTATRRRSACAFTARTWTVPWS